jgi:hypothetical protein
VGSDLYRVTALSKKATSVSLEVEVVHPDAMYLPEDPSFALMLLHEATGVGDPLAGEVSFNDTLDEGWMKQYAKGFIRAVKVSGVKNAPPKAAVRDGEHAYWKKRDWMHGRFDITVSDPQWIAHIEKGKGWDSRAFSLIADYDDCEPIEFGASTNAASDDDPIVWVPREVYVDHDQIDDSVPALLPMPAYAASAYAPKDKLLEAQANAVALRDWIGKPALVTNSWSTEMGVVVGVVADARVRLVTYSAGSRGSCTQDIVWIAEPVLKAGRRGTRLDQKKILDECPITTAAGSKSGTSLELAIRIPPGTTHPVSIASETDVLDVLVKQLFGSFRSWDRPAALSNALDADLAAHDMEGAHRVEEILPWVATKYITSWSLDMPERPAVTLGSSAETREILEAPWPTATLRATVSDARWLDHFDVAKPVVLRTYPMAKPSAPPPPSVAPVYPRPDARIVLVTDAKVWIGERFGSSWKLRTGARMRDKRDEKTYKLDSPEKAQAALEKAAAAQRKAKFHDAPSNDDASAILWRRLGLEIDDSSGRCIVTKATEKSSALGAGDLTFFRPKDLIERLDETHCFTIEELAAALDGRGKGATFYLHVQRPAARIGTGVLFRL